MNSRITKISILGIILLYGVFSCKKDDLTQQQLLKQQQAAQLKQLKALSGSDSLKYLLSLSQMKYKRYTDSLARVDSLSIAAGKATYLPYTYEVQVLDGSISSASLNNAGGRVGGTTKPAVKAQVFATAVTVTITQYGVKQTQTSTDGLFTFKNIGVGAINGSITCAGYAEFDWVVGVSLPYQIFVETVTAAIGTAGTGTSGGVGGSAPPTTIYTTNAYLLQNLLQYFNNRSFSNAFPIFATAGPTTGVITGRAFIETDLTNTTKEVVPAGTQITATIDVSSSSFTTQFIQNGTPVPNAVVPTLTTTALLNSVFPPRSFAIGYLGTAVTNATGDYTINVPGSPGGVPIKLSFNDVIANKTYFVPSNGDVSTVTQRNLYGPIASSSYSNVPNITASPTVTFFAGGGATAAAVTSGNSNVTAINLTNGGSGYLSTPRVIFSAPPAGGTKATATATMANGIVTGITLVSGGSGYTATPSITITEGPTGGSAATVSWASSLYSATNGGVANVSVTAAGTGYTTAPNVVFFADLNGNNALDTATEKQLTAANFPTGVNSGSFQSITPNNFPTATATVGGAGANNAVTSIAVTNAGGGLSFAPKVILSSGFGASANVTITGGKVTAATVATKGFFYLSAANTTLDLSPLGVPGVGGTNAVLTPTIAGGRITGYTITSAGTLYPLDGVYVISSINGAGSGAAASVVWQGLGIGTVTFTGGTAFSDGIVYSTTPSLVVSAPDYAGPGSKTALMTAVLGPNGQLVGVTITDGGSGYINTPTISVVVGSGASASTTFANKAITAINIAAGGSGYIVAPKIIITDPVGSGATATANLTNGVVTSINVTNPGSGYVNSGTIKVLFLDPGTAYDQNAQVIYSDPAQAIVLVSGGVVTAVNVYQVGSNYPAGTLMRIVSGMGSGFAGTPVVAGGQIASVTVSAGGTGYVGNNYVSLWTNSATGNNPNNLNTNGATSGFLNLAVTSTRLFSPANTVVAPSTAFFSYSTTSGVTRVLDIDYGTGRTSN